MAAIVGECALVAPVSLGVGIAVAKGALSAVGSGVFVVGNRSAHGDGFAASRLA